MFEHICPKAAWCPRKVLDTVLELAIEIAREGREGRRIGTLFTIGFADLVMNHSRPLILDPLAMHLAEARPVTDPNLRGTIKELAQLDGAFIIDLDTAAKDVGVWPRKPPSRRSVNFKRDRRDRDRRIRERGSAGFLRGTIAGRSPP